jgi:hypothetical protein
MGEPGAKSTLFMGLFAGGRKPCLIPKTKSGRYGLKDPKSSRRVVSSGSFTAFRMTARTCKGKGKGKGKSKGKGKGKGKTFGLAEVYFPRDRMVRDGWGTRAPVLGDRRTDSERS